MARELYWIEQDFRGRRDVRERLNYLLKTQTLSRSDLLKLQFDKLHSIITHAYATVPYYRRIMDERSLSPSSFHTFDDISRLPLLTREILRMNQNDLVSTAADHDTLTSNFSSGSTGIRAEFKQDLNFRIWMRAHQLRTYGWCSNWQLGEPFVLLWGSEIYWSSKQFVDKFENFISNRREFNTFCLSDKLVHAFLDELVNFNPVLISSYSNAIHLIAREAARHGVTIPALRSIQGTSEPLPPAMRDNIVKTFRCELFDKYGMRETNVIAHESPHHEEMCMQIENVFVEFLDESDRPVREGERGRIVVTTLNNMSMPLIRYETSDLAGPVSGVCSSGIELPRMTSVAGRLQDLIVSPKGDLIDAYLFSYLIMRFDEVHWFQVVQVDIDKLLIRVYAPRGLSNSTVNEIKERIQHHTNYPFHIEFEPLSAMPHSSTGKFRLCISEFGANDSFTSLLT